MVAREIAIRVFELVADFVGVHSLAIGVLATAVVGLYYVREVASLFVHLARYARMASVIGAILLLAYVGGVATGVVDAGTVRSIIAGVL